MSEAVVVHEVTKQFGNSKNPLVKRLSGVYGKVAFSAYGKGPAYGTPVTALERVSFSVAPCEIFGVIGREASGKSTLIHLVAALLFPDSGEIRVFDTDVTRQAAQVQRLVNPVSVKASFFLNFSPLENLVRGGNPVGIDGRDIRMQALELLRRLGFSPAEIDRPMASLPRLQIQKVTIARALLSPARLLLLDEPTAGLDPHAKSIIYALLRERRSQFGTTILLATQNPAEAAELCDRTAVLERGRLTAPPSQVSDSFGLPAIGKRSIKSYCS